MANVSSPCKMSLGGLHLSYLGKILCSWLDHQQWDPLVTSEAKLQGSVSSLRWAHRSRSLSPLFPVCHYTVIAVLRHGVHLSLNHIETLDWHPMWEASVLFSATSPGPFPSVAWWAFSVLGIFFYVFISFEIFITTSILFSAVGTQVYLRLETHVLRFHQFS